MLQLKLVGRKRNPLSRCPRPGRARVFDVAVVGLGAVGSSALFQIARRGAARVLGVDRFAPPHDRGSSHGESRIFRQAIGEGLAYVPFALRSRAIWEALEEATGERLLERCGFLFMTRDDGGTGHHGKSGFLARTVEAARLFDIEHEVIDSREIASRYAQFAGLHGDERAYFEPGGGYLRPERCIAVALSEARRFGATVITDVKVHAPKPVPGGVLLTTEEGDFLARRVVLAPGVWAVEFAGAELRKRISIYRQVLHWFRLEDVKRYAPGASPTFIWTHGLSSSDQFYGFPPIDGLVKVASEGLDHQLDVDGDRDVDPSAPIEMSARHIQGRLLGLSSTPLRSCVCPYATTQDSDFLIDALDEDVAFASACSGHGFKHAAAVGEALAEWALLERPSLDLSTFRLSRFTGSPDLRASSASEYPAR